MPTILGTRQDTWLVALAIEDPANPGDPYPDWGIWDTKTGGDIDSDDHLYYPGGMLPAYDLGGKPTPQSITLSRNYRIQRDHYRAQKLIDSVGKSNVRITIFPMDKYGNEHTPAIVYLGTLKTVTFPEINSESSSDPGMITIVCTIYSAPSAVGAPN
jgi:hypothetical protein